MTKKILVTYASRAGSTAGVAEEVGKVLTEKGFQVDVFPMSAVTDLSTYDGVVAGSAVQDRQWLPEAVQFIRTHQGTLESKPFAIFAVCMTLAMRNGESYRSQISGWLAPVRSLVQPVSEGLFAGVLDIQKIPSWRDRLKFRLSVLFGVWSEGDHRDWKDIREWANNLYLELTQGRDYV